MKSYCTHVFVLSRHEWTVPHCFCQFLSEFSIFLKTVFTEMPINRDRIIWILNIILWPSVKSIRLMTIIEAKMGQNGRRSKCSTFKETFCVIVTGVFAEWHFLRKIRAILRNFFLRIFSHEAEQLLRNIPHCYAPHATSFAHICTIFAKNLKLRKCFWANNKILSVKITINIMHRN